MARSADADGLIAAWRTNNRATVFLVEHLPLAVWSRQVPGIPRQTVGMIAAHIHNSRCSWIRSLGARHGVKVPRLVDLRRVRPLRANMRETVYPSEIREQGEEAKGLWTLHAGWMEDNRPWESRSEGAASEARRPAAEGLPRSSARRCRLGRSLRLTPR